MPIQPAGERDKFDQWLGQVLKLGSEQAEPSGRVRRRIMEVAAHSLPPDQAQSGGQVGLRVLFACLAWLDHDRYLAGAPLAGIRWCWWWIYPNPPLYA
jgi:hypothetical protein